MKNWIVVISLLSSWSALGSLPNHLICRDLFSQTDTQYIKTEIDKTQEIIEKNDFHTGTGLNDLFSIFHTSEKQNPEFSLKQTLKKLIQNSKKHQIQSELNNTPPQHDYVWFDSGTGQANAFKDLISSVPDHHLKLYGLNFKNRWIQFFDRFFFKPIHYLKGKRIEHYRIDELPAADIITDYMGPASYTDNWSAVINKYIYQIKQGGTIFIGPIDYRLQFIDAYGDFIRIEKELQSQLGDHFIVTRINNGALAIRYVSGEKKYLSDFILDRYTHDAPPIRTFKKQVQHKHD